MANTLSPFGFSQIGRVPGAPSPDFAQTKRLIANANTHKFFRGDLVTALASGYIDTAAAGGTACFGVFLGCEYLSTSQQKVIWSPFFNGADATGDITAYVCNDPYALFLVQSTGTNPVAFSDIGANIDISTTTAGSATTGISGMAVDSATINAATTTLPFRIWGLGSQFYPAQDVGIVQNIDDTTQYNLVQVTFNAQSLKQLAGI